MKPHTMTSRPSSDSIHSRVSEALVTMLTSCSRRSRDVPRELVVHHEDPPSHAGSARTGRCLRAERCRWKRDRARVLRIGVGA